MKRINTHGLTIQGLRAVCGRTTDWPCGSGCHTDVYYNRATGELWASDQVGSTWTQYDDPDIIRVCSTATHMTMQQLADLVYQAVLARRKMDEVYASICAAQ